MQSVSHARLRRARARFIAGHLLAYATESCFGLGGSPYHYHALKRVIQLKARSRTKGLIVIAAHIDQLRALIKPLSKEQYTRLQQVWPGHVTFLLPAKQGVLPLLRGHHTKIAVRITAHGGAAALCEALGSALVSTSANRAKQKPLKSARACLRAFGSRVLTLPGQIGKQRQPSTLIDFVSGRVLR